MNLPRVQGLPIAVLCWIGIVLAISLVVFSCVPKSRAIAYWVALALAISLVIVAVGAVLGALIWVTVGTIAGDARSAGELLAKGASIGWRYARVWAGGVAIILCFVKAHENFSLRRWWRARFHKRR